MSGNVEVILKRKSHHETMLTIVFSLCKQSAKFHRCLTDDHATSSIRLGVNTFQSISWFLHYLLTVWSHIFTGCSQGGKLTFGNISCPFKDDGNLQILHWTNICTSVGIYGEVGVVEEGELSVVWGWGGGCPRGPTQRAALLKTPVISWEIKVAR